jgi:predicted enzyme related to lactoylglutathione lyase
VIRNPVNWFEITVSDIDPAKRFYEAVFALTLTNMPSPDGEEYWTFPMSDTTMGDGGALTTMEDMQTRPRRQVIYFRQSIGLYSQS